MTGVIKYIIIIIIILVVVLLSQLVYVKEISGDILSNTSSKIAEYLSKGSNWVAATIYPKISGEVKSGGEVIQNNIEEEKNKISKSSKNILEKAKDYFSGIADSILHPGENNSCQPTQTN